MDKIVSLCKRRGFVFPGSEIYGGLGSTYDYGPLGVELKNNIKKLWWQMFIRQRRDMVGIDGGILMSPKIWEASGHVTNFKDPLVECKKCHNRFRPDKLKDASKCPDCGGEFTEQKMFSGMFQTEIGATQGEGLITYLRPETAGAIFANYKNVWQAKNLKLPFGIGQIGKAFRNEITSGNFIFRTYEFEQLEIEYFFDPESGDWNKLFEQWVEEMHRFFDALGLKRELLHDVEIADKDRAFYSKRTIDMEYDFPFGQEELWGIAYRTDYDLGRHQEFSGEDLTWFDQDTKRKFLPHVIEPSMGLDRTLLAVLLTAYDEEEIDGETRVVLRLKPMLAPYQIAVLPLSKKENLSAKANEVWQSLNGKWSVDYDETQSIGKRYRRQDEIGTPYCVTVDFDTIEKDNMVTVRDRDTMQQERIAVDQLVEYFNGKLN